MDTHEPERRDALHCPRCGAKGILPLDQPPNEHGGIVDSVMICPKCNHEFRATGVTWLGAFDVADMTDEGIEELATALVDWQDEQEAKRSGS